MWSNHLFHDFSRIASLAAVVCLCSCEADIFDGDSREIGGGYRLKRAGNPSHFALITPYEKSGLIIDEIGWREPLIFARAAGSQYWDVINTAHAQHIRINDVKRKSDSGYQSIQIETAEAAWSDLEQHKRRW